MPIHAYTTGPSHELYKVFNKYISVSRVRTRKGPDLICRLAVVHNTNPLSCALSEGEFSAETLNHKHWFSGCGPSKHQI